LNPIPTMPILPIRDIPHFFDEIANLFDEITTSWSPILFKEKFRQPILDAWYAVKSTIISIKSSFYSLVATTLDEAGLSGKQLDLKLTGLSDAWTSFKENGTLRFLKDLLGWVNSILGSLARVIPQVEGWKEFKEAIEKLLEPVGH
jgi:hypothetical protein